MYLKRAMKKQCILSMLALIKAALFPFGAQNKMKLGSIWLDKTIGSFVKMPPHDIRIRAHPQAHAH